LRLKARSAGNAAAAIEDYHHRHLAFEEYSITLLVEHPSAIADRLYRAFLHAETVLPPDGQAWSPRGFSGPMAVVSCNTHARGDRFYYEFTLRSVQDNT